MLKRKVFRDVIKQKVVGLEFGWFLRRAHNYAAIKIEKVRKSGKASSPLQATCILTEKCNLQCPMCDLPARYRRNPAESDTATWKRVIDELHEIGTAGLGFTGGEVTLRRDIFELISHARDYGMPVTLNTNALTLTDSRLPALIRSSPTNINISIDSGRDEVNDGLRGGKNVLARTLSRMERIAAFRNENGADFTITVVTVLSDLNIDDLEVLYRKVKNAGADRIGFMPLHDIEAGRCRIARFESDTSEIDDNIRSLSAQYELPIENSQHYVDDFPEVMGRTHAMPVTCNAAYTSITIGPDLTLYRCWPFFEEQRPLRRYDPATQSLREIWNDEKFRRERLESLSCRKCFWNCHAELSYLLRM